MEANFFAKVTRSTKVFFWTYVVLCIVAPTEVIINYGETRCSAAREEQVLTHGSRRGRGTTQPTSTSTERT